MRSLLRSKSSAGADDEAVGRRNPRPFVLEALGWSNRDAVGFLVAVLATIAVLANVLFLQSGPHPAPMLKSGLLPMAPSAAKQASVGALPGPRTGSPVPAVPGPSPAPGKPTTGKPEPQPPTRASAEIITDIQRELARRGFYDEAVDGRYGPKTEAAVRNFERGAGVKPSTEPNEALLRAITHWNAKAVKPATAGAPQALRPPAPIPAAPARSDAIAEVISPSKRVLAVQRALAEYGYGQIKPTGVIDGPTQAAIQKFERERKLPVTGQVSERVTRELASITGRSLD